MFEPIIFPSTNWDLLFCAALTEVIISGKEVPIATTVNPKKASDIPRIYEISKAELTVMLAPKKVKNTEISIIGIPNFIGFLTIILESLSLDSSLFSVWLEEFW